MKQRGRKNAPFFAPDGIIPRTAKRRVMKVITAADGYNIRFSGGKSMIVSLIR